MSGQNEEAFGALTLSASPYTLVARKTTPVPPRSCGNSPPCARQDARQIKARNTCRHRVGDPQEPLALYQIRVRLTHVGGSQAGFDLIQHRRLEEACDGSGDRFAFGL